MGQGHYICTHMLGALTLGWGRMEAGPVESLLPKYGTVCFVQVGSGQKVPLQGK